LPTGPKYKAVSTVAEHEPTPTSMVFDNAALDEESDDEGMLLGDLIDPRDA
jgi:hypothetical protein